MSSTSPRNNQSSNRPSAEGHIGALVAILVAILLGGLLGVFYGRQMWLAGAGPARTLVALEATLQQKEERATELENERPEEAARLRQHVPKIEARLDDVRLLQLQVEREGVSTTAYAAWEFTKFCGELFLQALKLIVVPLVITSMLCGITSLGDVRRLGQIGVWTLFYYLSTAAIAVLIGIILVLIIRPGVGADDTFAYITEDVQARQDASLVDTLLNVVRGQPGQPHTGMVPSNIFLAAGETNVLALIVFALVFGGALTTLGSRGQVAIDFFRAANEAIMKMVELVMWFAPLGIFGLVAWNIAKNGGGEAFVSEVMKLSKYVLAVCIGLSVHAVVLSLLLLIFGRRRPLRYLLGCARALLTALTTSSSSATLPITIQCVEENNHVSARAAGFVLPLGATINMDGTALYEAVAVIFIAQSLGVELSAGSLVVIFLTATLAAVGAAGIPSAGLVTMVIVLTAVGLPIAGIGLILAIDWFVDRLRTTVNVYGDAVGAGIIDRYLKSTVAVSGE